MKKADIGLIGLAVMGENLVMNMESKGFTVSVFNRTTEKVDNFIKGRAAGKNIIGCHSLEELVSGLEKPRKVFMMVKAGQAVDDMIEHLLPLLSFPRHHPPHGLCRIKGQALYRHGRIWRRRGGSAGPEHDARRLSGGMALCKADIPGHLR